MKPFGAEKNKFYRTKHLFAFNYGYLENTGTRQPDTTQLQ